MFKLSFSLCHKPIGEFIFNRINDIVVSTVKRKERPAIIEFFHCECFEAEI